MSTTSATANPVAVYPLQEMTEEAFFPAFKKALPIATDAIIESGESSITSLEVGDCLTVFGMSKEAGKISTIFGYHFLKETTQSAMKKMFKNEGVNAKYDDVCEIIIIGGNEDTLKTKALEKIKKCIQAIFAEKGKIVGEFLNLNKGRNEKFISVNLQMNGSLTFCRHHELV